MGHEYVGTEHALLALAADGSDVAGHVLAEIGLGAGAVRGEIEKRIGRGTGRGTPEGPLPWTPRLLSAVEYAGQEAWVVGQREVGPEHVLLGLMHEPDGLAGQVLRGRGLDVGTVRERVMRTRVLMMKVVERAVRPLCASVATKRRMREELLAHLAAIYEEEVGRSADPVAALDEAVRRFGDPGALSRELSLSLPARERVSHWLERWTGWRSPESAMRYLSRLAALTFCLLGACFALAGSVLLAAYGPDPDALVSLRVFAAVVVFTPLSQWVLGLLYYRMRDAMWGAFGVRRSWGRVVVLGVGFAAVTLALGSAFIATAGGDMRKAVEMLPAVAAGAVGATAFYAIWARVQGRYEIGDVVWATLDV